MRRNRKVQHSVWLGVLLGVAVAGQAGAGHVGARRDSGSQHGGRAQVVALLELSTGQPTVTMDEATRSRLGGALQRSLRGRKVTAELFEVAGDVAGGMWPQPSQCSDSECQAELCQKKELRQLLSVRVSRDGDEVRLVGQLYDAAMADFAAEVQTTCLGCDGERLATRLGGLTDELLKKAQLRKTGILEITSQPPGATVRLNGMRLGQTPLLVTTFAGEHRIEVLKPGFARYQNEVVVEAGRGAALDAFLTVEPGAPQGGEQGLPRRAELSPRLRRTVWSDPTPRS
jgi:hypothetical protein